MQDEVSRDDRFTPWLEQTGLKPGGLVLAKVDLGLECDQLIGEERNWIDVNENEILMYVGQDIWPDMIDSERGMERVSSPYEFPALVFLFEEKMVFWVLNSAENAMGATEGLQEAFSTSQEEIRKALALEEDNAA